MSDFLRHVAYEVYGTRQILSKAESTIALERVLSRMEETNNIAWMTMIPKLIDVFIGLSRSGLDLNELRHCSDSAVWQGVLTIFARYLDEVRGLNSFDLGMAVSAALREYDCSHYDEMIVDGSFLPIRPEHHKLITSFAQEKHVSFYLPCDLDYRDRPVLKAFQMTYEPYVPFEKWESIHLPKPRRFFVERLPKLFLAEEPPTTLDPSFSLLRFSTAEDELTHIADEISRLLRHGVDPQKIVVITPRFLEIRSEIQDLLLQRQIGGTEAPRPILHLPQGRALKSLYDIYLDYRGQGQAFVDARTLEAIALGCLFDDCAGLVGLFERLETFFADCTTFGQWYTRLDELMVAKKHVYPAQHQFHPVAWVDTEDLTRLIGFVRKVESTADALLSFPDGTIRAHTEKLIGFLSKVSSLNATQEFLERLVNIAESLTHQDRIPISAREFGSRIDAILVDEDTFEPIDEPSPAEETTLVLVTGPGRVELQRYDYVFMCGFTRDIYPETEPLCWPLNTEIMYEILSRTTKMGIQAPRELDKFYLDRALYQVYCAINAADKKLVISYSQIQDGLAQSPAHYLYDIANVMGVGSAEAEQCSSVEETLKQVGVLKDMQSVKPAQDYNTDASFESSLHLPDATFTVEDVFVYQHCPRRLYYQKRYPQLNTYNSEFQLQSYASSQLYSLAVRRLVEKNQFPMKEVFDQPRHRSRLVRGIPELIAEVEPIARICFPLSSQLWNSVRYQAGERLESLIWHVFHQNEYVRSIREKLLSPKIEVELTWNPEPDAIDIDGFRFTSQSELRVRYNRQRTHGYAISNREHLLYFLIDDPDVRTGMSQLKDWYFQLKSGFRREDPSVLRQLAEFGDKIRAGVFPKRVSSYCRFCAFEGICQARQVTRGVNSATEEDS